MPLNTGLSLIIAERMDQIAKWDSSHDAEHDSGELAKVAATLAIEHTDAMVIDPSGFIENRKDPWNLMDKHGDTIKRLTIAGALIAAEIDRILMDNNG